MCVRHLILFPGEGEYKRNGSWRNRRLLRARRRSSTSWARIWDAGGVERSRRSSASASDCGAKGKPAKSVDLHALSILHLSPTIRHGRPVRCFRGDGSVNFPLGNSRSGLRSNVRRYQSGGIMRMDAIWGSPGATRNENGTLNQSHTLRPTEPSAIWVEEIPESRLPPCSSPSGFHSGYLTVTHNSCPTIARGRP